MKYSGWAVLSLLYKYMIKIHSEFKHLDIKRIGLCLGLILFFVILLFFNIGSNASTNRMVALTIMMAIFWMTESIPLAATALLPVALLPILGISDSKTVATQYINSTVFLLMGGFLIALAMQQCQLHRRIALNILSQFGSSPTLVVIGFMLATAFLSMWISNTATTLMMLPIALAILNKYEDFLEKEHLHDYSICLLLSIAYSASVGGMMTLVGTAPNLVFSKYYQSVFNDSLSFFQWMKIAVPIGLLMLLIIWIILSIKYLKKIPVTKEMKPYFLTEKEKLGSLSDAEQKVMIVFSITCLLWITRKGIKFGGYMINGWSHFLKNGSMIDDGSVAIFMALLLFVLKADINANKKVPLLDGRVFYKLPWSIILLFGGGFALAHGFTESGLSVYLTGKLSVLNDVDLVIIMASVAAGMSLLTELTSNTATTQLVLPILISVADVLKVSSVLLMFPAVIAASCAFMFPVATPPNAIIFGSGKLKIMEMVKTGFLINLVAVVLITAISYFMLPFVFII